MSQGKCCGVVFLETLRVECKQPRIGILHFSFLCVVCLELYRLCCFRRPFAFHCPGFCQERADVLSVGDLAEVVYQAHYFVHSLLDLFLCAILDGEHLALEGLDGFRIADALEFVLALSLIVFLEDVAGKGFERRRDVPPVAVVELFADVVQHPTLHFWLLVHCFNEAIDGIVNHVVVREFNLQVGCKSELSSHVAEDALEERVDGLDAEVRIVVQDGGQRLASLFPDLFFGDGNAGLCKAFLEGVHVLARALQPHL